MKTLLFLFCFIGMLTGCAATPAMDAWSRQQGGCIVDSRVSRVETIGRSVASQTVGCPVTFHVLNNPSLGAFSWSSGDVFLTAGLVDAANDDEIAAAIAHELGHLLSKGRLTAAVSLRGQGPGGKSLDAEQEADLIGCRLLVATHRSPASLVGILTKVCQASSSHECQQDMHRRIEAIHRQFPS